MDLPVFEISIKKYRVPDWWSRKQTLLQELPLQYYTDFHANKSTGELPSYSDTLNYIIQEPMEDFASTYPCPVIISSIWYERSGTGDYHCPHTHGTTGYSAVLYVEFDSKVHQSTKFYSPFHDPMTGDLLEFQPNVSEGDLILFPSFLLHEAPVNTSEKERIIVSFNILGEDVVNGYYSGLMSKER